MMAAMEDRARIREEQAGASGHREEAVVAMTGGADCRLEEIEAALAVPRPTFADSMAEPKLLVTDE
jgi:hypothetical protein